MFSSVALLTAAALVAAKPPIPTRTSPIMPALASHPEWPKGGPETVSIDALVTAFYSAVSAPAGGRLDRLRLRSLFIPDGRFAIALPSTGQHAADMVFASPDAYADLSDAQTSTQGFFDSVIVNRAERFGAIAHVRSSYESRHSPNDAVPFARGIKSIEMLFSEGRWHITQVAYDREGPDARLSEDDLHPK